MRLQFPPDIRAHLKAGALVALAVLVLGTVLLQLGLRPLAVLLVVTGLGVGAAVEWAQWDSDRRGAAEGRLPLHDVSAWDLLASAAACLLLAAAAQAGWLDRWVPA